MCAPQYLPSAGAVRVVQALAATCWGLEIGCVELWREKRQGGTLPQKIDDFYLLHPFGLVQNTVNQIHDVTHDIKVHAR
jgi:hypothetical protein